MITLCITRATSPLRLPATGNTRSPATGQFAEHGKAPRMTDHRREHGVDLNAPTGTPEQRASREQEPPVRDSSEQYSKDATDRGLMPIGSTLEKGKPTVP